LTIVQVNKYIINYRTKEKQIYIKIYYQLGDASCSELIDVAQKDIDTVINMLRYEKPIFWSTNSRVLMTGPEEVGEEES